MSRCIFCLNRLYCCYYKFNNFKLHYHCIRPFYNANLYNPSLTTEDLEKLKILI